MLLNRKLENCWTFCRRSLEKLACGLFTSFHVPISWMFCYRVLLSCFVNMCPKLLSQIYSCEQQNGMPCLPPSLYLPLPTTTLLSFWLLTSLLGTLVSFSPRSPHQRPRSPGTLPSPLPVGEAGLGIHGAEPAEGVEQAAVPQPFPEWERGLNLSLLLIIGHAGGFWSYLQFGQFQTNLEWPEGRTHSATA